MAPLFVVASVGPGVVDVPVEVLFSLVVPADRSALDIAQDIYLLWPGDVVTSTFEPAAVKLPGDVQAQMTVTAEGRLELGARSHYEDSSQAQPIAGGAPFVTVVRRGGPLGLSPGATYIRIPWAPQLANPAWLVSLRFTARALIKPKPTTWLGRTLSGPRHLLALGFNDIGPPAMFSMYYWQRDRVLPAGSPGRLVVNFADAPRLAIDEMSPAAARREISPSLETTEVASLFLDPREGLLPQTLRVEFGYYSGLQSWGPVLIPMLFFALGNGVAVAARSLLEHARRSLIGRVQLGRRPALASGRERGAVVSRDQVAAIVPGQTTYDEVIARYGREVEEREDLGAPGRKTLIYRGRREIPHRRWTWGWLTTVDHWEVERHELEIAIDNGVVRDLQLRIGRARLTRPEA